MFDHVKEKCGTTLAIAAGKFSDIYDGPIFKKERMTGTEECPEYCLNVYELEQCPQKCECAYVREILQILKIWPKI